MGLHLKTLHNLLRERRFRKVTLEIMSGSEWMTFRARSRRSAFAGAYAGNRTLLASTFVAAMVLGGSNGAAQQNSAWTAPPSAKAVKNPVRATPQGLKEAGQLFQQACSTCHGVSGVGDGVLSKNLDPKPANFTDARKMRRMTDGELFWKMSTGRGAMPSWKQIPDKDRWRLVNYLRTLAGTNKTSAHNASN
jgi:mono/diheme cytochrome c family protein